MSRADEPFLSRWSRLKRRGQQSQAEAATATATATAPGDAAREQAGSRAPHVAASAGTSSPSPGSTLAPPATTPAGQAPAEAAPPALPPIESLLPESDFRPFMQAGVDAATRNAALARLFADPHFSVMDGLDVYIDDYGKSEPIPPSLMHHLDPTRSLGLFEPVPQVGAEAAPGRGETQVEFTHDESPGVARMRDAPAPNELLPTPDAQVLANVNPAENPEPQGTVADPNSRPTSK